MKKDFIAIKDLSCTELEQLIQAAHKLKIRQKKGIPFKPLEGKSLGMIFHKPSARTRISFDVGMYQLGGHNLILTEQEIGFGKRESIYDLAQLFSRMMDIVMIRTFHHNDVLELAHHSIIPVINGLTDYNHPCQILADLLTLFESGKSFKHLKVIFVGDGNNVCMSWFSAAALLGIDFTLACPEKYTIPVEKLQWAYQQAEKSGAQLQIIHDPVTAVTNSDVIYTDTWTSMGQEMEAEIRRKDFSDYQVNKKLLSHAKDTVSIMHCLPAHRGEEITDEIIDSPQSLVFDQAENRLHAQKAVLLWLLAPEQFMALLSEK